SLKDGPFAFGDAGEEIRHFSYLHAFDGVSPSFGRSAIDVDRVSFDDGGFLPFLLSRACSGCYQVDHDQYR
ncbi:MAG: hypothetical protein REI12_08020, partial [Pedobacter sp.]|nr:hypothetical protein [Pedobacter sp.]